MYNIIYAVVGSILSLFTGMCEDSIYSTQEALVSKEPLVSSFQQAEFARSPDIVDAAFIDSKSLIFITKHELFRGPPSSFLNKAKWEVAKISGASLVAIRVHDRKNFTLITSKAIYHSNDQARTWRFKQAIVGRNIDIAPHHSKNLIAVASDRYLYLSSSRGRDWNKVGLPTYQDYSDYRFELPRKSRGRRYSWEKRSIHVFSPEKLVVVFRYKSPAATFHTVVFKSTNAGQSWKEIYNQPVTHVHEAHLFTGINQGVTLSKQHIYDFRPQSNDIKKPTISDLNFYKQYGYKPYASRNLHILPVNYGVIIKEGRRGKWVPSPIGELVGGFRQLKGITTYKDKLFFTFGKGLAYFRKGLSGPWRSFNRPLVYGFRQIEMTGQKSGFGIDNNGRLLSTLDYRLGWTTHPRNSKPGLSKINRLPNGSVRGFSTVHLYEINHSTGLHRASSKMPFFAKAGVFVKDSSAYFVSMKNRFWFTHDFGQSWTKGKKLKGHQEKFERLSTNEIWLLGRGSNYRSLNNGKSWREFNIAIGNDLIDYLYKAGKDVLYACTRGRFFLSSKDNGSTWTKKKITQLTGARYTNRCQGMAFKDESKGMMIVDNKLYQTLDGGISWKVIAGDVDRPASLNFSKNHIFIGGSTNNDFSSLMVPYLSGS